ncbi:Protein of unknown function [Gryllus bimaculatus]|nr:Protein of unknown function [Gryllus bimaculatus]
MRPSITAKATAAATAAAAATEETKSWRMSTQGEDEEEEEDDVGRCDVSRLDHTGSQQAGQSLCGTAQAVGSTGRLSLPPSQIENRLAPPGPSTVVYYTGTKAAMTPPARAAQLRRVRWAPVRWQ